MNYLSVQFALFLTAAVFGFYLCPRRHRSLYLLLASYAFYVLWSPFAALGILSATIFAFLMARLLEPEPNDPEGGDTRRRVMALSIAVLLVYLGFFKLLGPLKALVAAGTASGWILTIPSSKLLMPLGISYYTFKLISYMVDVYWEKIPAERRFIDFATYVAFFPQIVAGPIQRSGDFLEQIRNLSPGPDMIRSGLGRLLLGCFKKAVIADNLSSFIGLAYSPPHGSVVGSTLPAFYLFPLQLYADFSALTDIAIGVGRLFGLQSPENFDSPFSATSISQYWRRWHMTLTNWLSDYVFLPLRMATRQAGNWGLAFSLMVNMLLIGLWHSVSWTFAVFGLLHGVFMVVDALTTRSRSKFFKSHARWNLIAEWCGPILTFHLVALGMVFVRAESLPQALHVVSRLFDTSLNLLGAIQSRETACGLIGLGLWGAFEHLKRQRWIRPILSPVWVRWAFYYSVIAVIVKYGHKANGFIYFRF